MEKPSFLHRLIKSVSHTRDGVPRSALRGTRKVISLCHSLVSERGEVSGARIARETLDACLSLEGPALEAFYDSVAQEFSPKPDAVVNAAQAYQEDPSQANLVRLQQVIESPRQELFRRLNMVPGGTSALIEMRRRIMRELGTKPHWVGIDADLYHLLASWFNRGFLVLQRIDWRTSALVLEKLTQYEAVHRILEWRDLRRRLQGDRRCYAFFHPVLPDEPVIFIEVALTRGMSAKIQPLLELDSEVVDPNTANCAIFYSITNCQDGLRGVSFGNLLIKQVAEDLGREFPRLKTFATLSPVLGFRTWLAEAAASPAHRAKQSDLLALLARIEQPLWFEDKVACAEIQKPLVRLCSNYLLHAKHGREPLDPVARFHLGNGARMQRLNWLGDTSEAGMSRSAGLMVNYVYRLSELEANHEAYARERRIIASSRFEALATESVLAAPSRDSQPIHA
jgi:malonyl-CoA decarboxylase